MGRVYLAEHKLIGKRAAVKVLLPRYSADAEVVNRFFNEARASSLLKHPGVVDVYDFGKLADGSAFIVMEFLEGESLAARIRRERTLTPQALIAIARQIATAVGAAHAKRIVHRDLKPDNVFLVSDSEMPPLGLRVKVLDFGIAKLAGNPSASAVQTQAAAVFGTPTYMSPEQCRGTGLVDHRSDIYSLGCIMYETATGRAPFVGEGTGDIIAAHLRETPVPPSHYSPSVPTWLDALIIRALAKKPAGRYQSMAELVTALDACVGQATEVGPGVDRAAAPTLRTSNVAPSTTLGAASGETWVPTSIRRRSVRISAVAAVIMAGGFGVYFSLPRGTKTTAAPTLPVAAAPSPATSLPSLPVEPAKITLTIESRPAGADVFRVADGVRLGTTPLVKELARTDGDALFVIKLAGYLDERVKMATDRDGVATIDLTRRPRSVTKSSAVVQPKPSTKAVVLDPFH
jgi:serine/threonine-protein kinase